MNKFEDEVLYGISIDGNKPGLWSEKYPSEQEIEFNLAPRFKTIEIVEKAVTYETVAKIR